MMRSNRALVATVACAALAAEGSTRQEEMLEVFRRYATPGEGHERLGQMAGTWELVSVWQPPDLDADPVERRGEIEARMIFGGRFLHQTQQGGEVMGVPFEGWGLLGFDNHRQVFQQIWFDSAGTGILVREGHCGEDCGTIVLEGEFEDPFAGGRLVRTRTVYRSDHADAYVVEHYEQSGSAPERLAIRTTARRMVATSGGGLATRSDAGEAPAPAPARWGAPRQLTDWPGEENNARFSPDGRRIAFQGWRTGNAEIYVMDLASGEVQQITDDPAFDGRPDFSPDGTEIAFQSDRSGVTTLWSMPASGGTARRLVDRPDLVLYGPDWAPDGQRIAATGIGEGGAHAWLFTVADGSLERVTDGGDEYWPRWSPDSRRLLIYTGRTDNIVEIDLADRTQRSINRGRFNGWRPVYGPRGDSIVFVSESGRWSLFELALEEAAEPRRLTRDGAAGFPDWSPDGSGVVYSSLSGPSSLEIVTADTGHVATLDIGDLHAPQFLSDGRVVAMSDAIEPFELKLLDGGRALDIGAGIIPMTSFSVSPAGGSVVFTAPDPARPLTGSHKVYRLSLHGGVPERLTDVDAEHATWCGEDLVVFSSLGPAGARPRQVWGLRPSAGSLTRLTDSDIGLWPSDCARDGRRLAVTTIGQGHALLMDQDDEGEWQITDLGPGEGATFAPDGERVAFLQSEGSLRYLMIREPDGTTRRITYDFAQRSWPRWSADGARIIVSRTEGSRDLWFLPRVEGAVEGARSRDVPSLQEAADSCEAPIAFVSVRHGAVAADGSTLDSLYIMNPDGTHPTEVVVGDPDATLPNFPPKWTPDADSLVYYSRRTGTLEIYRIDLASGVDHQLTSGEGRSWVPAVAPDGRRVAFASDRDGNVDIYVMNIDGTDEVRVTSNPAPDFFPTWSPDGSRIAFQSSRDGDDDIFAVDLDSGVVESLVGSELPETFAHWSPDGTKLAFQRSDALNPDDTDIFVIDLVSRTEHRVTDDPGHDSDPSWSPDSQYLVWASDRTGAQEIYRARADGTELVQLTATGVRDAHPNWARSPRCVRPASCC